MPPQPSGSIDVVVLADGSRAFRLRFRALGKRQREVLHERRGCACGCGGGWDERRARVELDNTLARVRAGIWQSRQAAPASVAPASVPTFHEYASAWLIAKTQGVLGDKPIDDNTRSDYRWRLSRHLLPFFARYRIDEIDREICLAFKARKLQESHELREALAAGADLKDRQGRRARSLSPASIRKLIDTLAAILDDAIEDELIDRNPARGKRMRVRVPKPTRTFLEMDELVAVIEAADAQDRNATAIRIGAGDTTRDRVAGLAVEGRGPSRLEAKGLPPLPNVTPHTMRRTYISIALIANGFDVKWVMSQVGHADSMMTLDVYAQLEKRAERSHGTAFDELLRRAKRRLDESS